MTTSKLKIKLRISQLIRKIATKFKRLNLRFGVRLFTKTIGNIVRPTITKAEVENPTWRPLNLNYMYLSLYTR